MKTPACSSSGVFTFLLNLLLHGCYFYFTFSVWLSYTHKKFLYAPFAIGIIGITAVLYNLYIIGTKEDLRSFILKKIFFPSLLLVLTAMISCMAKFFIPSKSNLFIIGSALTFWFLNSILIGFFMTPKLEPLWKKSLLALGLSSIILIPFLKLKFRLFIYFESLI